MPLHGLVRDPHHPVIFPGSAMHLPTVLTARLTPHLPGKGFLPAVFGFHQHEVTFPSPALEKTPSPVLTHRRVPLHPQQVSLLEVASVPLFLIHCFLSCCSSRAGPGLSCSFCSPTTQNGAWHVLWL